MKNSIFFGTAALMAGLATPAAAQFGSTGYTIELQARIEAGVLSGRIDRNEAEQLRDRLRDVRDLERSLSQNGLTQDERQRIQNEVQALRQQIRDAEQNSGYDAGNGGGYGGGYGGGISAQIDALQDRLQRGVQNGSIDRNEAVQLRERLRQLRLLERDLSRDGLSRSERDRLQNEVQSLRQQIDNADRGGGYDDGDANDGNLSGRIDELRSRLEQGIRSGRISRSEAMSRRMQIRDLERLESQFSRDGLSRDEVKELRKRTRDLERRIRDAEGRGGNGGYGRDNDDDDDDDDD